MKNDPIDNLFKEALADAEATPSKGVWTKIEQQVGRKKPATPHRLHRFLIAASFIFCVGIALLFVINTDKGTEEPLYATQSNTTDNSEKGNAIDSPSAPSSPKGVGLHQEEEERKAPGTDANSPAVFTQTQEQDSSKEHISVIALKTQHLPEIEQSLLSHDDREEARTPLHLPALSLASLDVEPIKPLIELPEYEDSMLAHQEQKTKNSLVTTILNTLVNSFQDESDRKVEFSTDEEQTIRIDIINSLARNRKKK